MIKDCYRVLSIDFDFFQDTDAYTMVSNYPDGIDANTFLSTLIWTSHYAKRPKQNDSLLDDVTINEHLFNQIVRVIRNQQDHSVPVLACNSHVNIYHELESILSESIGDGEGICIDHIDFHHDFENGNETVDCGNWVSKILELFPNAQVRWFARELGIDIYKIEPEKLTPFAFNLDAILDIQYDYIFLCRSDNWLPPHLDKWFDDLLEEIHSAFGENVYVQECVASPRDINSILASARKQEELYARYYEETSCMEGDIDADGDSAE